jgi:pimeloyl-ACP methyl ester carboxylesterase
MIGNLVQVRRYLTEPDVRRAVRQRVVDAVDGETRVIVAHSLGSVVAYEALAAHPDWPVRALVTLGSPLGIANLIFDRLHPRPRPRTDLAAGEDGVRGGWPGPVTVWTNVADKGDVVALVKDLRPLFGERVVSCLVHNGATAHDIRPYLTAPETGTGILAGLTAAEHR